MSPSLLKWLNKILVSRTETRKEKLLEVTPQTVNPEATYKHHTSRLLGAMRAILTLVQFGLPRGLQGSHIGGPYCLYL